MELPNALYLGASVSLCFLPLESTHSPISTQWSGKPCSLVHYIGVNLLTKYLYVSVGSKIVIGSCIQFNVCATSSV